MKLFKFSFYPYLRSSAATSKDGSPVYMRISHMGLRKDYSLKLKVEPTDWDDEFKQVRGKSKASRNANLHLKQEVEKVEKTIRDLYDELGEYSLDELHARLKNGNKSALLLEFYQSILAENEMRIKVDDLSINTQRVYRTTFKHLNNFLAKSLKRNDFPIKAIDYSFLQQLQLFLKSSKRIGQNALNKYMKTLKAVLNEAKRRKLIRENPFENFQLKSGTYDRTTLNAKEMKLIMNYKPKNEAEQNAKDFFVFAANTGMHYQDVKELKEEHIIEEDDINYIVKRRTKNGHKSILHLLPIAQEIIDAHEKLPKRGNKLLYLYTNQKINLHLKVIAKECGIAKKITCKVARHTFATAALNSGLTLEQTGLMLGHTDTHTTAIYGKMNINGIKSQRKNLETIYA
jgi:site-specific recombinase XerD